MTNAMAKTDAVKLTVPMQVALTNRRRVPVQSLEDAAASCREYIATNGLGSSEWSGGKVYDGHGKHIATVSYNGRVWGPKRWEPGDKPLIP